MLRTQPRSSEGTPVRNRTLDLQETSVSKLTDSIHMAKPSSNRRLFQADGYTFIRWIEEWDVERMLTAKEIEACFDIRTNRALGFKLVARKSESISDTSSLLPFSRPTRPEDKFHYEIPHAGDCRSVCIRRFRLRRKLEDGKHLLVSRVLKVSARKIDFTATAYLPPTHPRGVNPSHPNAPSSSLDSAMVSPA